MQEELTPGKRLSWAKWVISAVVNFLKKVGLKGFFGSLTAELEIADGVLLRPKINEGTKAPGKNDPK